MNQIELFFTELNFDFKNQLIPKDISFEDNILLNNKLKKGIFYYENTNQSNSSFYLITKELDFSELDILRKYIWNENQVELLFCMLNDQSSKIKLLYSKVSPLYELEKCEIDTFDIFGKDTEKMDKIKKWKFDSGAFWIGYQNFINRLKYKGIDKELISTLNILKNNISNELQKIDTKEETREEIVQAFIDRTLYIKYLEDNHIINSYFYTHYFKSPRITYIKLLEGHKRNELNKLFSVIQGTFNNGLFDQPNIEDKFITYEICSLIANSLKGHNYKTRQLSLFDFQFNVIPVQFISYIYEIFLSDKQKANGIYYTPKKLAQLIIDDVIIEDKVGKILDPSCGSGMFLIVAFQKLLEIYPEKNHKDVSKKIEHRTKLLAENIFGIEKQKTAQRFTIFSLSLQLFRGLDPTQIKNYIANQLKTFGKVDLFAKYDFSKNIICANSLAPNNTIFKDITFEYIVGNPPFFEIKKSIESNSEIQFLENYNVRLKNNVFKAKDIVGEFQISQCFFLKMKDWSNQNTRFGFVSNSSNFYNDNSNKFQNYFYSEYNIEKIYELSRVKKILFENAKESVVSLIFTNNLIPKNRIEYYPVDMGLFSEKPFELLLIQEDKIVEINQKDLESNTIKLRDYLVGNEFDRKIQEKFESQLKLKNLILIEDNKAFVHEGITTIGKQAVLKEFGINSEHWERYSKEKQIEYFELFKRKYISSKKTNYHNIPLIKPNLLSSFWFEQPDTFLIEDNTKYERGRELKIFTGKRIILNRVGKNLKAIYLNKELLYHSSDLFALKLKNNNNIFVVLSILNSQLANYYLNYFHRKRIFDTHSKIGVDDLMQLPIPNDLDEDIVEKITLISKQLIRGKAVNQNDLELKLNELIFDLYDLSYMERQRIKDYFISKVAVSKSKRELVKYQSILIRTMSFHFKDKIEVEFSYQNQSPLIAKIYFGSKKENTPNASRTAYYLLNEIFNQNSNENFLATQEKIYSKDCIYIIKDNMNTSWTETKAFEDGQEILKHIR